MKSKSKRIVIVVIIIYSLCIGFLGFKYLDTNSERLFLQDGVDAIFTGNFCSLCSNLFSMDTSKMDNQALDFYNYQNTEYSHTMMTLFSSTSYSDNFDLNTIVFTLDKMTGSNSIYKIVDNPELIERLNRLSYSLNSDDFEETAASISAQLLDELEELPRN